MRAMRESHCCVLYLATGSSVNTKEKKIQLKQQQSTTAYSMQQDNNSAGQAVQVRINDEQVPISEPAGARPTTATSWIDILFKRHMIYDPLMILFSVFVLVLGIVGYVSKGSVPSIISGTVFFLVLMLTTHVEGVRRNSYPLVATLTVLFMFMGFRYLKKKEFWPSGLVAVLSLFLLSRHIYILIARPKPA